MDRVDVEGGGTSACQSGVVVLAGETLARLTNGYFRPTFHEVVGGSAGPLLPSCLTWRLVIYLSAQWYDYDVMMIMMMMKAAFKI